MKQIEKLGSKTEYGYINVLKDKINELIDKVNKLEKQLRVMQEDFEEEDGPGEIGGDPEFYK